MKEYAVRNIRLCVPVRLPHGRDGHGGQHNRQGKVHRLRSLRQGLPGRRDKPCAGADAAPTAQDRGRDRRDEKACPEQSKRGKPCANHLQ